MRQRLLLNTQSMDGEMQGAVRRLDGSSAVCRACDALQHVSRVHRGGYNLLTVWNYGSAIVLEYFPSNDLMYSKQILSRNSAAVSPLVDT